MSAVSPRSAEAADAHRVAGAAMYRFLECKAGQYMTRAVETVTHERTLRELGALFETHDFNAFPVLEAGKLIGIVTKLDFLRAFAFTTDQIVPHYDELMRRTVGELMSTDVLYVMPTTALTRVLELMVSHRTRSIPVLSADGQLLGMISREDVMRALREATDLRDVP
jgi:CBS domain-containing protein